MELAYGWELREHRARDLPGAPLVGSCAVKTTQC
jgi:hypothetical protein